MNRTVRVVIVASAALTIAVASFLLGFGTSLVMTRASDRYAAAVGPAPSAPYTVVTPPAGIATPAPHPTFPTAANTTPVPAGTAAREVEQRFQVFWEALKNVTDNYYDQTLIDPQKMVYGAIKGMVESIGDAHTYFSPPEQLRQSQETLEGAFEGIGATIELKDGKLQIVAPIAGSPAQNAGIRPGDWIAKIDGTDTTDMSVTDGVTRIRGKKGTTVVLTIVRDGTPDPFDVSIVRDVISVPNVKLTMLKDEIAYIQLVNVFSANMTDDLKTALRDARQKGAKKVILDVRGNPGGYLRTAIEVASQFVKDGTIVSELARDGKKTDFPAIRGGLATDLPIVVLVNKGSASASEIVAGAIQDSGRGPLIGETTYGKGSVQQDFALSDGSAVHVTIANWLTPKGRSISKAGLKPDIVITITEEDIKAKADPQLDRAVQYLETGK